MRPHDPAAHRPDANNAHRHNGIIQRLGIHRVRSRQAEYDGDEADPAARDECDGAGEHAQIEGAFLCNELALVDEADEDGDAVGDVESDGGDGGCGCEGDAGAEGGDGEEEGEEGGEPDGADGGAEAGVYGVEECGLGKAGEVSLCLCGNGQRREGLTRPPSRLNPNIIRLLEVIENRPQCQTQRMIKVKRTIAPSSPKTSTKICSTG